MAARKMVPVKQPATRTAPKGNGALVARLEAEKAELAAKLTAARERIVALERQRDEALNRIEWVIDSLHTLAEDAR